MAVKTLSKTSTHRGGKTPSPKNNKVALPKNSTLETIKHDNNNKINIIDYPDLVQKVLEHCTSRTLNRCLRVNTLMSSLAGPQLYRHLNINLSDPKSIFSQLQGTPPSKGSGSLGDILANNPNSSTWKVALLDNVRKVTMTGEHYHKDHNTILKGNFYLPNVDIIYFKPHWNHGFLTRWCDKSTCNLLSAIPNPSHMVFNTHGIAFDLSTAFLAAMESWELESLTFICTPSDRMTICENSVMAPSFGKMKLPNEVTIVFQTKNPDTLWEHNNYIYETKNTKVKLVVYKTMLWKQLVWLPYAYPETVFTIVNADAIDAEDFKIKAISRALEPEEVEGKDFIGLVKWGIVDCKFSQYGQTGAGIWKDPPFKIDICKAKRQEALGRLHFMGMKEYMRVKGWKGVVAAKDIEGWLQ